MKVTNENMLRGCIQEAQTASILLTQAIAGIRTCASPQSPQEARVFWLLRTNSRAIDEINNLLDAIELTGHED